MRFISIASAAATCAWFLLSAAVIGNTLEVGSCLQKFFLLVGEEFPLRVALHGEE